MRASSLFKTFSKSTARFRLDLDLVLLEVGLPADGDWESMGFSLSSSSTERLDANSAAVRSSSASRTHMQSLSLRSLVLDWGSALAEDWVVVVVVVRGKESGDGGDVDALSFGTVASNPFWSLT